MISMDPEHCLPDKLKLAHNFNAAVKDYDDIAILQKTVAERLLEHLELIRIRPGRILDLGAGTGGSARTLAKRFRQARVVQLDMAVNMLRYSRGRSPALFSRQSFVCADAERLPFPPAAFDMIYSSLVIQWCHYLDDLFAGLRQCLKGSGLFIFSTLGPDTLHELRESWASVDDLVHVNTFMDMHDVGDALIRAGFADPVMEVEQLTLTYPDVLTLLHDLKHLGVHNVNSGRRQTLTGKTRFENMVAAYESHRVGNRLPATYEVVYGHAWVPEIARGGGAESRFSVIPVASIKRRG